MQVISSWEQAQLTTSKVRMVEMKFKRETMSIQYMEDKADDSVQAGFGNDNIHADDGVDAVFAGPNYDQENDGNGNDELYAQDEDDTLEG